MFFSMKKQSVSFPNHEKQVNHKFHCSAANRSHSLLQHRNTWEQSRDIFFFLLCSWAASNNYSNLRPWAMLWFWQHQFCGFTSFGVNRIIYHHHTNFINRLMEIGRQLRRSPIWPLAQVRANTKCRPGFGEGFVQTGLTKLQRWSFHKDSGKPLPLLIVINERNVSLSAV